MNTTTMILVMVDETGDEIEVARYTLTLDLDADELAIWQERKVHQASDQYPEARGFYWEDRSSWTSAIARDLHQWF